MTDRQNHPQKHTDEARQGVTGTGTRYVLGISTALAALILIGVVWIFAGSPHMGFGDDMQSSDVNPPYGLKKENPATPGLETGNKPMPTANAADGVPQDGPAGGR